MCEIFFSKQDQEIQIIDSMYTNGAPAMLGSVFFVWSNQHISHLQGTHCFLYQHALISKTLPLGESEF